MAASAHSAWWRDYFDERYLEISRSRLPAAKSRAEVAAVIELLGLPVGARILDVPCGWGRHSVPLAEARFRVTGADLSSVQLEAAREYARQSGVEVEWIQTDMRLLPWRECFDAVISLFSSLGYFDRDEEDLAALRAFRAALRPGGVLLLETMHRDALARHYAPRDWWETEVGTVVRVERRFDAVAGVNHEWMHWQRGADAGEKDHRMRVRTVTEWDALLRAAGLAPESWYGGWNGRPFTHESPRLVVLARRAA
ncbi:MAG TPA: class I SAM-dependent methyltransferase [Longimicrobiaceae bacterium]|nr:class I SAM-dependent methyltransferase [Longimicrobiaceae bacterium]